MRTWIALTHVIATVTTVGPSDDDDPEQRAKRQLALKNRATLTGLRYRLWGRDPERYPEVPAQMNWLLVWAAAFERKHPTYEIPASLRRNLDHYARHAVERQL
jgi:hypothetical protein